MAAPRPVVLEASEDGKTFEKVADVNFKSGDVLIKFPAKKAKFWRIVRKDNYRDWENKTGIIDVLGLELVSPGEVPAKMPFIQAQLAKVNIVPHRSSTSMPLPYDDIPVPENAVIDSKDVHIFKDALDADGNFKWNVPAGKWNIMRLGFTTSGRRVHPATKGGAGLEIDKMSKKAVDTHFDSYIKKMIETAGADAGKIFKYVETDSWECGNQSWTDGLDDIFKKENGYDMLKFAPTFVGDCVGGKQRTEAFASDLRAVTSKLVMENFYGRLGERIRESGLLYESEPASETFMCDPMYGFKVSDIPQHEVWRECARHKRRRRSAVCDGGEWQMGQCPERLALLRQRVHHMRISIAGKRKLDRLPKFPQRSHGHDIAFGLQRDGIPFIHTPAGLRAFPVGRWSRGGRS